MRHLLIRRDRGVDVRESLQVPLISRPRHPLYFARLEMALGTADFSSPLSYGT